jgi:hypothetical protein
VGESACPDNFNTSLSPCDPHSSCTQWATSPDASYGEAACPHQYTAEYSIQPVATGKLTYLVEEGEPIDQTDCATAHAYVSGWIYDSLQDANVPAGTIQVAGFWDGTQCTFQLNGEPYNLINPSRQEVAYVAGGVYVSKLYRGQWLTYYKKAKVGITYTP